MRSFVLSILLASAASSALDQLTLVPGNTWLYRQEIQKGPTSPTIVFQARTTLRLDSVLRKADSTVLVTRWIDSATVPEEVYDYRVRYHLTASGLAAVKTTGVPNEYVDVALPLFLRKDLPGDSLILVTWQGERRLFAKWQSGGGPGFGAYANGGALQGVGVIRSIVGDFGTLRRDHADLELLRFNGAPFDIGSIKRVTPMGILHPDRNAPATAVSPRGFPWSGAAWRADGRIRRDRALLPR